MHFIKAAWEILSSVYEKYGFGAAFLALSGGAIGLILGSAIFGTNRDMESNAALYGFLAVAGVILGGLFGARLSASSD